MMPPTRGNDVTKASGNGLKRVIEKTMLAIRKTRRAENRGRGSDSIVDKRVMIVRVLIATSKRSVVQHLCKPTNIRRTIRRMTAGTTVTRHGRSRRGDSIPLTRSHQEASEAVKRGEGVKKHGQASAAAGNINHYIINSQ